MLLLTVRQILRSEYLPFYVQGPLGSVGHNKQRFHEMVLLNMPLPHSVERIIETG